MGHWFWITPEIAEQLLLAEDTCFSEGQAGLPSVLMQFIKQNFPDLAERNKHLWQGWRGH